MALVAKNRIVVSVPGPPLGPMPNPPTCRCGSGDAGVSCSIHPLVIRNAMGKLTPMDFTVNSERCTHCGLCVLECPTRIIVQGEDGIPTIVEEEAEDCMRCQHCLAICPTGAISVFGQDPDESLPLIQEELPTLDAMSRLVKGRRSVRHYADENVDPALIRQLLGTVANAPTGVNRQELTFSVIDDRKTMQTIRETAIDMLAAMGEAGQLPEDNPFLARLVEAYREEGRDLAFRGAPHALIVSAPPDAPCPPQDVALALAYFELLAQSAGLGTGWCGLMAMVLNALPELKDMVGLPQDAVHYEMLFGIPLLQYARTVQRDDGAVIRSVKLS